MVAHRRRVLVTGASRGLGRALAEEFARHGHTVLGCARSRGPLEELARVLGPPHDFAAVDVTVGAEVRAWAETILSSGGPPDLILNNAGAINRNAPLWKVPEEEFSRVIDANVKGVMNVIRAFLPAMIERRRGVIVNFSSGWGRFAAPEVGPYVTSKWAIEGLSRSLALELPEGMACVPLSPGIIETDMTHSCFGDGAVRHQKPQEWARAAVPFLLQIGPEDNGKPLIAPGGDI